MPEDRDEEFIEVSTPNRNSAPVVNTSVITNGENVALRERRLPVLLRQTVGIDCGMETAYLP